MKIAVLGAGAMGMLIGGFLSTANDVTLIDINTQAVDKINADGVVIHQADGTVATVHPAATADSAGMQPVELIVVFVKAMYSRAALQANRHLIDSDTCLMTLQNGAGHEDTLLEFADQAHIIIGTTQHNSSIAALGEVNHGGCGHTYIGCLSGDVYRLQPVADAFNASGLAASVDADVKKLIWSKMFTNVSASALTGALQCPLGYISADADAWHLCETLIREAVAVANANGMGFDVEQKIAEVRTVCDNSPGGITSICADIAQGRKSEVDTISGSVVRASRRNGVAAPSHEFLVRLIHAIENRPKS